MLTGLLVLEQTDWPRLHHAYGRAADTPGHLRALLEGDDKQRKAALFHLWSAIIHQGTPWTATGPAALFIAGLLRDKGLAPALEPVRAELFSFLVSVAEVARLSDEDVQELGRMAADHDLDALIDSGDDEALYDVAGEAFYARALLGCVRAAPVLMDVMLQGLTDADPRVRAYASQGATTLAESCSQAGEVESKLAALARAARDSDERCAYVLALGELGAAPADFLDDASPAVRMCAALAPGLAGNAAATAELLNALERHAGDIDGWFVNKPPQFEFRPRFAVVAQLLERVTDFERLADAAVAVLAVTTRNCVDFDWGPLLAAAFPEGRGEVRTAAQRRFLGELVNRPALWDPRFGNAFKWFQKAGLPYDRQACAERVSRCPG